MKYIFLHFVRRYVVIISILFLVLLLLKLKYGCKKPPASNSSESLLYENGNTSLPVRHLLRNETIKYLQNSLVIVTVCARNVDQYLPLFQQKVTEIVSIFKDYQILIGESDSTDETWNYLKQWALIDSHVTIETYGELSKIYCSRSVRIAHCRNRLLDTARKNGWLREAPFYLVMDVDVNANNVLTLKNFLTNFEYPLEQWAVMTATQDTIYYDIWALRSHFVDYDCWQMVDNLANAGYCHSALVEKFVGNFQKPIPHEYGLIEVQSAFGGFGIYSTKYLNNCAYYAYTNYEICEHVTFHQCIKANGGRIFINSRFRNAGTYET